MISALILLLLLIFLELSGWTVPKLPPFLAGLTATSEAGTTGCEETGTRRGPDVSSRPAPSAARPTAP
jgi:hypothetical protein